MFFFIFKLKNYSRTILESKNLSSISDPSTLSKILPGISRRDLNKIDTSAKVSALVNLVNASLSNGVPLTSTQVRFNQFLNVLYFFYLKNFLSCILESWHACEFVRRVEIYIGINWSSWLLEKFNFVPVGSSIPFVHRSQVNLTLIEFWIIIFWLKSNI